MRRVNNSESTATTNPSATYLASFSVTYLATSLKLAKFTVTERTAVVAVWSTPVKHYGVNAALCCIAAKKLGLG